MTKPTFIGREAELEELGRFVRKKTASFLVIQGRRRIGKSRLVAEFANNLNLCMFSGLPPHDATSKQSQLDEFAYQLGQLLGTPGIKADDWNALFLLLAQHTQNGRVVIFLDEISWMGSKDPDFLGKLKNAWDLHFKKNPQLILIVCGSASAWIEKNILSSTGFLGRVSFVLTLEELPLKDCVKLWHGLGIKLSVYEKFKLLSVIGGVPRYLEEIQVHKTAEENIRDLCFKKGAMLTHEFERIFSDLFSSRTEKYKAIVKNLADGPLEYKEICQKLGVEKTGLISEYINDLIKSGFIRRDFSWHFRTAKVSRLLSHYRLSDNYLRFYLKYIEKNLPDIEKGSFSLKSLAAQPGWATIMGFQFENLVLNNREFIQQALHLRPEDIAADNPFFQRKTARQAGCQIDYLIQTKFNALFACEIKFSRQELKLEVVEEMKEKLKRLSLPRGFSCVPVLVHVNGVHDSVIDSNYFSEIIDFSQLLDS